MKFYTAFYKRVAHTFLGSFGFFITIIIITVISLALQLVFMTVYCQCPTLQELVIKFFPLYYGISSLYMLQLRRRQVESSRSIGRYSLEGFYNHCKGKLKIISLSYRVVCSDMQWCRQFSFRHVFIQGIIDMDRNGNFCTET